jgi:hypothetical protein
MFGDAALGALNLRMVAIARSVGAAAKFTGSGGAIVAFCPMGEEQEKLLHGEVERAGAAGGQAGAGRSGVGLAWGRSCSGPALWPPPHQPRARPPATQTSARPRASPWCRWRSRRRPGPTSSSRSCRPRRRPPPEPGAARPRAHAGPRAPAPLPYPKDSSWDASPSAFLFFPLPAARRHPEPSCPNRNATPARSTHRLHPGARAPRRPAPQQTPNKEGGHTQGRASLARGFFRPGASTRAHVLIGDAFRLTDMHDLLVLPLACRVSRHQVGALNPAQRARRARAGRGRRHHAPPLAYHARQRV